MGKSERNSSKQMISQNQNNINQRSGELKGMIDPALSDQMSKANELQGQIKNTWSGYSGSTGAYDPTQYKELMGSGGYDPTQLTNLRETGGYDPTQLASLRSGYGELAKTGGISEDTANAMRNQATSGVQSVYSTMGTNLARKQGATGFGGAGGETAQLARQTANESANATTGANAKIGELRQQGTIEGLKGQSGLEGNIANTRAGVEANVSKARQDLASGAATQRIQAAGGLQQLYSSDPGYVKSLLTSAMQEYQTTGYLSQQNAGLMTELSKQPGLFQTIMGDISSIAGGVGGIMTGVGSLHGKK